MILGVWAFGAGKELISGSGMRDGMGRGMNRQVGSADGCARKQLGTACHSCSDVKSKSSWSSLTQSPHCAAHASC
jgi:hypothetical protein